MDGESVPPNSSWQLLAEFALEPEPDSIQPAAVLVTKAVQDLGIQAATAEHIQRTVLEALQAILDNEKLVQQVTRILIRIWVPEVPLDKQDEENDCQHIHNWGFFLLEKQFTRSGLIYRRLELYIYRETE